MSQKEWAVGFTGAQPLGPGKAGVWDAFQWDDDSV